MIYLDNTTYTQSLYIPRKAIEPKYRKDIEEVNLRPLKINISDVKVVDNLLSYETVVGPTQNTNGYNSVTVSMEIPMSTKRFTDNGLFSFVEPVGAVEIDVEGGAEINNQYIEAEINSNGEYEFTFDPTQYTGLGSIRIIVSVGENDDPEDDCKPYVVSFSDGVWSPSSIEENVIDLCNYDFSQCESYTEKLPITNAVTSFVAEFDNARKLEWLFAETYDKIENVTLLNTSNVESIKGLFRDSNVRNIGVLDLSSCTDATEAFAGASHFVDLKLINTDKLSNVYQMFAYSTGENVEISLPSCTSISEMFYGNYNVKNITLKDTENVTNAMYAFADCEQLDTLSEVDFTSVGDTWGCFSNLWNIKNTGGFKNANCELDLSWSPLLTTESLGNIIENLRNINGQGTKNLKLCSESIAKLTDDMISEITLKGWNLMEKNNE